MTNDQMKTLKIVASTLVVLLGAILIGFIVYWITGDAATSGGIGTAATAMAAEASRRRSASKQQVEDTEKAASDLARSVLSASKGAKEAMHKEATKVGAESDSEKVQDGNDLFK